MFYTSKKAVVLLVGVSIALLTGTTQAQLLDDAEWFEREVGDGIVWHYYQFDDLFSSKQSVSYMEIDLSNPNIDIAIPYRDSYVGPSPGTSSIDYPRAPTSTLAGEVPNAKAALNGTYFNTTSYDSDNPTTPWGGGTTYLKIGGTIIHPFDNGSINKVGMGLVYDTKANFTLMRRPAGGWASEEANWANVMACGPVLLEDGTVETYTAGNTHATARHPRSAVGLTLDNRMILLAVDGRTAEAAGMSCTELAQVMKALGCDDAMNLDGGGSTTLWGDGEPYSGVLNYPSDNGEYDHLGQRNCANAIVFSSTAPTVESWDGRLTSLSAGNVIRTGQSYSVTAVYENIGTETWTSSAVSIVPSRAFGRTSEFVPAGQENTFFTMDPVSVAPGGTATFTLDLTPPDVSTDTVYVESFALWHGTEGFFGPADNELRFAVTVRPEIVGAPPPMIIQGGTTGANNQWYEEVGAWAPSTVQFTAPGVDNPGTQRYTSASSTGKEAIFRPVFDVSGVYTVEVAFPSSSNSIEVVYTVSDRNGTTTYNINQNQSGGLVNQWNSLGQFEFTDSSTKATGVHWVSVSNPVITGNRFYSGAVRFVYVSPFSQVLGWELVD